MASKTTEITAANLEPLNKRDLERLCRRHSLRPYGLKSQLLARLRAHRAALSSDSTAPPASSASIEPGLPATVALSPHPPLLPAATSTPLAPHRSAGAAAFSPEQQAYIEPGLSLARGSGSLTPSFRLGPPRTKSKGSSGPPRFCGAMRGDADRALIV